MENRKTKGKLHIAMDSLALLSPTSKNRGIGNYAYDQFLTMLQRDSENEYYFFNVLEELEEDSPFLSFSNFHAEFFYCGKKNFLCNDKRYEELIGNLIRAFIRKNKIDVFYITAPFDSCFFTYQKEWFDGIRVVATVYDIIPYMMRSHYFKFVDKKWYMGCIEMLRSTDLIFTISQSAKDDMIKELSFPDEQIKVIWGAVGKNYEQIDFEEPEKEKVCQKFGICNQYILCSGGDDERKNIAGLIQAYAFLPESLRKEYQLVVACKLSPESVERYTTLISKVNCVQRVILTNFVSFDELVILYSAATLLAFPSKYEGFGLPIVEAWACGTAVLTSDNSSLVQIAGDAAILVDPYNVADIARGLTEALTTADLKLLAQKGRERLELFRWERVADTAIEGINSLAVNHMDGKYRIAMFTPLPPVKSGIADYSVDIIYEISQYFDIDVFVDSSYDSKCITAENVRIYKHRQFESRKKNYKEIVYQMGNSDAHFYMYEYIRKYPGIVVLHDLNLNGAAMHYSFSVKKKNKIYEKMLKEDFTEKQTEQYMKKVVDGSIWSDVYEIVLNGYIVNYAKRIIVHSNYAKERLLERDIKRIVSMIPHYSADEKDNPYGRIREQLNISSDQIVIGCFGHIHSTKRAIPILMAYHRLCQKYNNLSLYYVGKLDASIKDEFNHVLNSDEALKSSVVVTGYISLDEFNMYMDCVDIALNLRYPYNGENSGSAARLLRKGKCVLVSDIGSFSEISDTACMKLPDVHSLTVEQEVDIIVDSLIELLESKELRDQYGSEAAKYAKEELSLERVGRKYRDVIVNDCTACLDEKMLEMIGGNIDSGYYTKHEIEMLARTLAFTKKVDFV